MDVYLLSTIHSITGVVLLILVMLHPASGDTVEYVL